jgi:rhamnulokinase
MKKYYLAFDIGASSGRAMLGEVYDDKVALTELYRFKNSYTKILGHYYWNIYSIFEELQNGIKAFSEKFRHNFQTPVLNSIGVDTWGVDFGLLDKNGNILNLPLSYRDYITDRGVEKFTSKVMDAERLYGITGIQFLKFNSLFQLYALKGENKSIIDNAGGLLFIPDLLNYLFTGIRKTEYTIASTSQMLDVHTKSWSEEIIRVMGISREVFGDIIQPGTVIGEISGDIAESLNIKPVPVTAVAGHDTASAIIAIPAKGENWAYLSSGTWSLMGIELNEPIISKKSLEADFTNEGGIDGTIRFLKNICGMWILEQCKKQWDEDKILSYDALIKMSEEGKQFQSFINPDAAEFANPMNMVEAIKEFCRKTGQTVPETIGQTVRIIFESLAMKYCYTMELLKEFSPKPIELLHIIGGGCRNEMLCQLTANALGMPVVVGPSEATALGNIMVQAMADKRVSSLKEIREMVSASTDIVKYIPKDREAWDKAYPKFVKILK